MKSHMTGKQTKSLLGVFALLLILPAVYYGAKLVTENRSRAAGTYEVGMKFVPTSGSFNISQNVNLQLKINKIASRTIRVSGVQAIVNVGDKFSVVGAQCLAPFNGLPFVKVEGQTVTIFCAISTSATPVTLSTTDMSIATLNLIVDPYATDGTTQVSFASTRVTEVGIIGQAPDVSTAGTLSTYTIIATPPCPRAAQGNLDCSLDSCIDTADFELFRQDFGKTTAEVFVAEGHSTPDLVKDATEMIDTADYEIFRSNFGSCQ